MILTFNKESLSFTMNEKKRPAKAESTNVESQSVPDDEKNVDDIDNPVQ